MVDRVAAAGAQVFSPCGPGHMRCSKERGRPAQWPVLLAFACYAWEFAGSSVKVSSCKVLPGNQTAGLADARDAVAIIGVDATSSASALTLTGTCCLECHVVVFLVSSEGPIL